MPYACSYNFYECTFKNRSMLFFLMGSQYDAQKTSYVAVASVALRRPRKSTASDCVGGSVCRAR